MLWFALSGLCRVLARELLMLCSGILLLPQTQADQWGLEVYSKQAAIVGLRVVSAEYLE